MQLKKNQDQFRNENPMLTLIKFSVGPVLSETSELIFALTLCIFLGKKSQLGLAAISAAEPLENICPIVGWWIQAGVSSHVSRLLAQSNTKQIKVVCLWSMLISMVISGLLALILFLVLDKLMPVMGISGDLVKEVKTFLNPLLFAAPVITLYYTLSGIAFGLGYVRFFTCISAGPILLGIAIIQPTMILWLNMGTYGAALAQVLTYVVLVVIYLVFYIWFEKMVRIFSFQTAHLKGDFVSTQRNLLKVLHIGLPELVAAYTWVITVAVGYKLLGDISRPMQLYEQISALWGIISRFMSLIFSFTNGVNIGTLTTASFSQGDLNQSRFWAFIKSNFTVCCGVAAVFEILFMVIPKQLLELFGVDEKVIELGIQVFRISLSCTFIQPICYCTQIMFQSLDMAWYSLAITIISVLVTPGMYLLTYYTTQKQNKILVFMASSAFSDIVLTVVCALFWITSKKKMAEQWTQMENKKEDLQQNEVKPLLDETVAYT